MATAVYEYQPVGWDIFIDASEKAAGHEAAADGIERQLATSVYDDDADAVERLEEQIVELEAKRDRIKSYNASCRKNPATVAGDLGLLSEEQREDILSLARIGFLSDNGSFPAYALTNLGATIREKKKRVERLRSEQAVRDAGGRGRGREMDARYGGTCADCGVEIGRGERIVWYRLTKEAVHAICPSADAEPPGSIDYPPDFRPDPVDQTIAEAARHFYGDSPEVEQAIDSERRAFHGESPLGVPSDGARAFQQGYGEAV